MTRSDLARQLWLRIETIHAVTYFGVETKQAAAARGLDRFWVGYFAMRAAPLGEVGAGVVEATFANFAPTFVRRWVPGCWSIASPVTALDGRREGAAATLRATVPGIDRVATDTAELLDRAIAAGDALARPLFAANRDLGIQQLTADDGPRDGVVTICGMITGIQRKQTKDGKVWAILSVEDLDASIEVLVFNKAYAPVAMSLGTDVVVRIKGRLRDRDDSVELTASDVSFPDVSAGPSGPVTISLPTARCTPEVVEQLKFTLRQHPGTQEVRVRLVSPQRATVWRLDDRLRVQNTNSLVADLKALLGPSCVSA